MTRDFKKLTLLAAVATTLALTACGSDSGGGGADAGDNGNAGHSGSGAADADNARDDAGLITGVEWLPETVTAGGQTYHRPDDSDTEDWHVVIDPDNEAAGGGLSGVYVGCNHMGADARVEGDTIRVTDPATTLMGCPEDEARFEQDIWGIFTSSPQFELSDSGDALTLTGANGDSVDLVRGASEPPITGVRWVPESVTIDGEETARPDDARGAYLKIEPASTPEDGGEADLDSGCNHLDATAAIADDTLTLSDVSVTEMACPGLMKFEEGVFDVITDNPAFEVSDSGDALTLTSANGDSIALVRADDR